MHTPKELFEALLDHNAPNPEGLQEIGKWMDEMTEAGFTERQAKVLMGMFCISQGNSEERSVDDA